MFYFVLLLAAGTVGWLKMGSAATPTHSASAAIVVTLVAAFILAIVVSFQPQIARYVGWLYALLEGFVLGAISAIYNAQYHGIVLEAIGCTIGVAFVVWFLYGTGIIKVTGKVRRVIIAATLGAVLYYVVTLLIMLFTGTNIDATGGLLGVGVSVLLAVIAAANLLVDFDLIDRWQIQGVSSNYNAYGAFALLVTLVWLYLEILNILAKLRGGRIR
jgi:uncharacterized YccA/Bax inhibitor family protein